MNISLTSHLLPLQPPFPLIYVGEPYYKVVRQLATLIVPREPDSHAQSKDLFVSVPVIDDKNILCGMVYNQSITKEDTVFPLHIKEGDKNIPWEKIIYSTGLFLKDKLDNINTVGQQILEFAKTLEACECTIEKPNFITIIADVNFDDKGSIDGVHLSSEEIPYFLEHISPSFSNDDCKKLNLFVDKIYAYKPLFFGKFKTKIECDNRPSKPELQETIDKILERIEYAFDVADGKYISLSEWKEEEIREELLWVQKNASLCLMGSDSKTIILNALGKRMAVHPCDFPKLWDIIISNNWVWFDEYGGLYKINISNK